jgi:hypothetical protein
MKLKQVTPAQAVLAERLVLVLGAALMVLAVATLDWRLGLFFAGLLLVLSALDLRRRP